MKIVPLNLILLLTLSPFSIAQQYPLKHQFGLITIFLLKQIVGRCNEKTANI